MEELFKAKTQDRFLALAYKFYRDRTHIVREVAGRSYILKYTREDVKHWLYKLGRDYKLLDMDYLEFERFLLGKNKSYYGGHWYQPWIHHRWARVWGHNCPPEQWRVLRGFFFNGQAKKSKEETPHDAWRKHKKFRKDKNKARYWHRGKKDLKHFGAKKHRAMERVAIAGDRIDNLGANSYKEAENPWSWD